MGTTLYTLHIFGGGREDVSGMLRDTDVVRMNNPPWLSILCAGDEPDRGAKRLAAMARHQTRPCILFRYMDDDFFLIQLYLNGRQAGHINSLGGTSRLNSFAAVLDGGDPRDLKLISKCVDIDEALALAEELLGTALFDLPEEEPRHVPRSRRVLEAIQTREKAIRSRPNRYRLQAVQQEQWPAPIQARVRMMEALDMLRGPMLHGLEGGYWAGAQSDTAIACSYLDMGGGVICMDVAENRLWEIRAGRRRGPVVGLTREGHPIVPCFTPSGLGYDSIICLNPDGGERWRFAPPLPAGGRIDTCPVHLPGMVMAFTFLTGKDTELWLISAEDGRILKQRTLPGCEDLREMHHWAERKRLVFFSPKRRVFVLLDENLMDVGEVSVGDDRERYDYYAFHLGGEVWKQNSSTGKLQVFDLASGIRRQVHLEVPGSFHSVFPDGRICALSGTAGTVMLYDANGRLLSRLRLKGSVAQFIHRAGESLLVEIDLEAPADAAPRDLIRVWRIEPAQMKKRSQ